MSTLFGINRPNTHLKKNVFDLSERSLYSQSAGQLLPVGVWEMNPGEKARINLGAYTRSMPVNTAAFVTNRQYFHWFFVPFKQLWSGWDNFINGVDYKTSALQNGKTYNRVPSLKLQTLLVRLICDKYFVGRPEFASSSASERPLSVSRRVTDPVVGSTSRASVRYWSEMPIDDNPNLGLYVNTPRDGRYFDEHGYSLATGTSRLLDLLGYGLTFVDASGNVEYRTLTEFLDAEFPAYRSDGAWHVYTIEEVKKKITSQVSVNPFRLLAYQKIYNDFYKRDDYEATNPLAFNIDDLAGGSTLDGLEVGRLMEMVKLRYRWLPKDYFTGVVPSELYGASGVLASGFNDGRSSVSVQTATSYGDSTNWENQVSINKVTTKSIRAAFAIEKLMRLTRRAGGFDYISQTAAHYGFEPPKGRGDKVQFLGGYTNTIDISEVVTTSNYSGEVDGDPIGNIAGQVYGKGVGTSKDNKPINFQAQEHGILMCISSIVPELNYSADGLSRFNAKFDRGDYFHPEFQDLGLQPVFGYELIHPLADKSTTSARSMNAILGYSPMYSEYKASYDKLHGTFRNGGSLSAWAASQLLDYRYTGPYPRKSGINISTLKINPKCLDRIFGVAYDGTEDSDQFIVSCQFVVKMIRPMSVTGQRL